MIAGYKVVAVIPAGRKRTMSLLMKYLAREQRSGLLDGCQVWENTKDMDDLHWLRKLPMSYPWVEVKEPIGGWVEPKQRNTGKFYIHTMDRDTIYVRFDDDILYLHEDALNNLLKWHINHPDFFLVFPQIWNNAIISWLQMRAGHISPERGVVDGPYCMDPIGWGDPSFGEHAHRTLLEHIYADTVEDLYINDYELKEVARFSISCFSFFGSRMDDWNRKDPAHRPNLPPNGDEEIWLTENIPSDLGWRNVVIGNSIVSHFTFFTQQAHILSTDILDHYRHIADSKTQADYYDQLAKNS